MGGDACRPLAQEPQRHGNVVRTETPQGVLVGPHLAQVHALAVNVEDGSEFAAGHHLLQIFHRGMEHQQMSHEHRPFAGVDSPNKVLGILHGQRHGFFDEDRQAPGHGRPGHIRVGDDRGGHDHAVGDLERLVEVGRHQHPGILAPHRLTPVVAQVANGGEFRLGQTRDGADVVAAPVPRPDHRDAHLAHG